MSSSLTLRKCLTQSHTNISSLSWADMVSMVGFSSGLVISCKIVSNVLFWKVKAQTGPWFTLVSPQGSIVGPVLFLLYVNDIPENLSCSSKMFADDTQLFNSDQPSSVHQHDRTENACTVSTSCCPIQSLRKLF